MHLDRSDPIRCIAMEKLRESLEPCKCSGEPLGCSWEGTATGKEGHESGCLAARGQRRFETLEKQISELANRTNRVEDEQRALKTDVQAAKAAGGGGQSGGGPGERMVIWESCVAQWTKNAVAGVSLSAKALSPYGAMHRDHGRATYSIFCVIPGVGFLRGIDVMFTAEYDPSRLRAVSIVCLSLRRSMPSVRLTPETAELTLVELVLSMQQAASTCPVQGEAHGNLPQSGYQEMARREAYDYSEQPSVRLPPSGYTSLAETDARNLPGYGMWGVDSSGRRYMKASARVAPDSVISTSCLPQKTIKLGNLAYRARESDITSEFERRGHRIATVSIPRDTRNRHKPMGHALLYFADSTSAHRAYDEVQLHGAPMFLGRPTWVTWA